MLNIDGESDQLIIGRLFTDWMDGIVEKNINTIASKCYFCIKVLMMP